MSVAGLTFWIFLERFQKGGWWFANWGGFSFKPTITRRILFLTGGFTPGVAGLHFKCSVLEMSLTWLFLVGSVITVSFSRLNLYLNVWTFLSQCSISSFWMSLRYCSINDVPKNCIWYLLDPAIYPFSWIFPKLLLTAIQLKINLYSPVEEETNYGDFRRVVGKKRGVTLKVIPTSFQGVNLLSLIWYPTPGNPGGGRLCQIWSYHKYCY